MNKLSISEYLEYIKKEKSLTDNTLESYSRDLIQFNKYLEDNHIMSIEQVNKTTIITYMMYLQKDGKSSATIARSLASIRSYFQYLLNMGFVDEDPTYNLRSPKQEKKLPDILTKEEIDLLLSQPTEDNFKGVRDKAMLVLLYETGIRITELIALNVDNLNMELGCLFLNTYDENNALLPINSLALTCLKNYMENYRYKLVKNHDEKALFLNYNGSRLTRQGFWKIIRQYSHKANIDKKITPMTLRHSFAVRLENGENTRKDNKYAGVF